MAVHRCEVEVCREELSEGTGSKGGPMLCPSCRSSNYYWNRKGPKALAARRTVIELYASRYEYYAPYIGKTLKAASDRVKAARSRADDATTRH